jgi:hypothetical protein
VRGLTIRNFFRVNGRIAERWRFSPANVRKTFDRLTNSENVNRW